MTARALDRLLVDVDEERMDITARCHAVSRSLPPGHALTVLRAVNVLLAALVADTKKAA